MVTIPGITKITYLSDKKKNCLIYNFGNYKFTITYLKNLCFKSNVFIDLVQLEVLCLKQSEHGCYIECIDLLKVTNNQMILTN